MTNTLTDKSDNGLCQAPVASDAVTYSPRFDIWETEDELVLYGDMPGVLPENVDVRYEKGQLLIHGRVCARHDGIHFANGEYGIGDYHRSFSVGEMIDAEKISAELKHGVLTLRLSKSEKAKPRRIEVTSA